MQRIIQASCCACFNEADDTDGCGNTNSILWQINLIRWHYTEISVGSTMCIQLMHSVEIQVSLTDEGEKAEGNRGK